MVLVVSIHHVDWHGRAEQITWCLGNRENAFAACLSPFSTLSGPSSDGGGIYLLNESPQILCN